MATRDIAEVIGRHLSLPLVSVDPREAADHFGWLGAFFACDAPPPTLSPASGWAGSRPIQG